VALANLDLLAREGLIQRAADLGRLLNARMETLATHPHVGDVRGLGLMAAVELVEEKAGKTPYPATFAAGPKVHAATQERGVITRLRGDVYNVAPCYAIEERQIERIVQVLAESIDVVL